MNKIVQILLFVISYVPLYLILFFQNLNDNLFDKGTKNFIGIKEAVLLNIVSISFLFLILFSISLYFVFFRIVIKAASEKFEIKEIKDNYSEHLSYLATYILPFIGLKLNSWQNILATLSLFYVLGHIYIKTNLILINPTLTFFGYSISKVCDEKGKNKLVIHKGNLIENKEMNFVPLIKNIFILKKQELRYDEKRNHSTNSTIK